MFSQDYKDCLDYIDAYWDKIIHKPSSMTVRGKFTNYMPEFLKRTKKNHNYNVVAIPHAYITPNDKKFDYIFYWDTFFMFKGIMGTRRQWVMKEMIDNFMYLFNTFGVIPNFNAPVSLGRSQPPFLTSMILDAVKKVSKVGKVSEVSEGNKKHKTFDTSDTFDTYSTFLNWGGERGWLKKAIDTAKKEYELVWVDSANIYNHHVNGYTLSRYGDRDVGYAHSSELESGWDFTSRFYNRCNHFLPIDLNTLLYKYECDFAYVAQLFNQPNEEAKWLEKAYERKQAINNLMWSEKDGFFFDYGWYYKTQSEFYSLASYIPLWAGLATAEQAEKMVNHLQRFETQYGLTITDKASLARPIDLSKIQRRYHPAIEEIIHPKQWDYPNIWSPLEYLTVIGLLRYGYIDEAKRIMTASVKSHASLYRTYGTFFEKINAETGEPGVHFHYENQSGFGWTNAAFYRYILILDHLEQNKPLYIGNTVKNPPFTLAIPH
jgi:alpha,alpha-trehalase